MTTAPSAARAWRHRGAKLPVRDRAPRLEGAVALSAAPESSREVAAVRAAAALERGATGKSETGARWRVRGALAAPSGAAAALRARRTPDPRREHAPKYESTL